MARAFGLHFLFLCILILAASQAGVLMLCNRSYGQVIGLPGGQVVADNQGFIPFRQVNNQQPITHGNFVPAAQAPPRPLRALFIGNSYTYSNDLPAIIQGLAAAGGDSLGYAMEVPDGASLEEHYRRGSVGIGLRDGSWDFVVLQEQSLRPALPIRQVEKEFFRYGELLDKQVKTRHPRAKTVLYVTWGRWSHTGSLCWQMPTACDYWGIDSLITLRYNMLAGRIGARLALAGPAWRYMQQHHPETELFNPDAIHPSLEGSYLAACCLYAALFEKDPACLAYDYVLSPDMAALLREVASRVAWNGEE